MPRFNRDASSPESTNASTDSSQCLPFPRRIQAQLANLNQRGKRRLGVFIAALCVCAVVSAGLLQTRSNATSTGFNSAAAIARIVANRGAMAFAPAPLGVTYFSQGSLPPELVASWNTLPGGGGVPPANFTGGDVFVIQSGHNMSTIGTWSISGSGSILQITNGGTLTANNAVTLAAATLFQIDAGGTYVHNNTVAYASTIFNGTESFAPTSTVTLTNSNGTGPANVAFGNLTVNMPTVSGTVQCSGAINTINGNLTIVNTNGSEFRLTSGSNLTLAIGGDLAVQGGILTLSSGAGITTVNLGGNFSQTGGIFTSVSGPHAINFTGGTSFVTFTRSSGTFTNTHINWSIANGKTVQFNNNFTLPAGRTFTIASGGMLLEAAQFLNTGTMTVNGEFRLTDGGLGAGNAFVYGAGATLGFVASSSYGVTPPVAYWPSTNSPTNVTVLGLGVTLNGSVPAVSGLFQTSSDVSGANNLTVNGTCQINSGGFFSGSPTYGSSSLLKYNTGGNYGRAGEWLPGATTGAGYPATVQIGANTTLDLPNGTFASPFQSSGNLTIDSGSTLSMGAMTAQLTVIGNINNNGILTLSTAGGGDIRTQGNWTNTGTFNHNSRGVYFDGSAPLQTITRAGGETFGHLLITKPSGSLQLLSNATVNATSGGVLQLLGTATFDLNGYTLGLTGNGGYILAASGSRTITSTGSPGLVRFQGSKSVDTLGGGTLIFGNCIVELGAPVDFGGGFSTVQGTLRLKSGGSVNTNPPTYAVGSTISYDTGGVFNAAAEFPATGVYQVDFESTTQLNLNGDKTIGGTLNVADRTIGTTGASPFSLNADSFSANGGTISVNNLVTTTSGLASGTSTINIAGNWNVTGFDGFTSSTVNFNGTGNQSIQTASNFRNLTASNNINLSASPSVSGTLNLGSNKITTGTNTLTASGTVNRTSGYIIGNLQRSFTCSAGPGCLVTFDVGTANGYSPVSESLTISQAGGYSQTVNAVEGQHPNISGTNALQRYWILSTPSGPGNTTPADITFNYLSGTPPAGDIVGTPANYIFFKNAAGVWSSYAPSGTPSSTSATISGVASFSEWTLAEAAAVEEGSLAFFDGATSNINEGNAGPTLKNVCVTRSGGTDGAVSVNYATSDGTAEDDNPGSEDNDYVATSGTLNWADSESGDKCFDVTINGDTTFEPTETINITLSSPTGGVTISQAGHIINVQNDDAAPLQGVAFDVDNTTIGKLYESNGTLAWSVPRLNDGALAMDQSDFGVYTGNGSHTIGGGGTTYKYNAAGGLAWTGTLGSGGVCNWYYVNGAAVDTTSGTPGVVFTEGSCHGSMGKSNRLTGLQLWGVGTNDIQDPTIDPVNGQNYAITYGGPFNKIFSVTTGGSSTSFTSCQGLSELNPADGNLYRGGNMGAGGCGLQLSQLNKAALATPNWSFNVPGITSFDSLALQPWSGGYIYVGSVNDSKVVVVNPATQTVVRSFTTAVPPGLMAVNPDGGTLYIANGSANFVYAYSPQGTLLWTSPDLGGPVYNLASPKNVVGTAPNEGDYCVLQTPSSFSVPSGGASPSIFGRVFEAGVTPPLGSDPSITAQIGFGPLGSDPRTGPGNGWTWSSSSFNTQVGNDDEYIGTFTAPTVGVTTQFSYTYRFSFDNGANYTYADLDGNGTNIGLSFSTAQLGTMTVTVQGETNVSVDGSGNLVVTDGNGGTSVDSLTLSLVAGPNIRIHDPNNALACGVGATAVNANTCDVPQSSVTGNIQVDTQGGNDTLTLAMAGGDFIPSGGVSYAGGGQTGTPGDKLVITGGAQGTVTYNYTNANDGNIVMSAYGTVTYTGLEPITNDGNATDIIFNLPATANAATLGNNGTTGDGISRLSGATFEVTDFMNPTGSVTINRGDAADTLTFNGTPDLDASLTIGSLANPFSTIGLTGPLALAVNKNLAAYATGTISLPSTTSDLTTSGTGSMTLSTLRNIVASAGSSISVVNGAITLTANQGTPTAGTFVGIDLNGATLTTSGTGNISLTGKGGSTGLANYGVKLQNAARLDSTGSVGDGNTQGKIIVNGTGGAGTSGNSGIHLVGTAALITQITSVNGNVEITGAAAGAGTSAHGMLIQNSAQVISTGTAKITANGTASSSATQNNVGVYLVNAATVIPRITSASGDILVTGTGGGNGTSTLNIGVRVEFGGQITSTGAARVTIQGTRGNGTDSNYGVWLTGSSGANSSLISSVDGDVVVTGQPGGTVTGTGNYGVVVSAGGSAGSRIASTGNAKVTVNGTGGNGGASNFGVYLTSPNTAITSVTGDIAVTGQGGAGTGNGNYGVIVFDNSGVSTTQINSTGAAKVTINGTGGGTGASITNTGVYILGSTTSGSVSRVSSTGGDISITGTGGNGTSLGLNLFTKGSVVAAGAANIALIADQINIDAGANPSSVTGASVVSVRPKTATTPIGLGASDFTAALGLTDAELDRIIAPTLNIGDSTSGTITVSADLTRAASTIMSLTSGGDVIVSGQVNTGGGTLLLDPGVSPFAVKPTSAGTDVTASTLSFGSDLAIAINGLTVDTQYDQLNVAGIVNITGVSLVLTGTHTPVAGQTFTIVNNDSTDSIVGTFTGLAEGATINNFLGSTLDATITYAGGTDSNDVVLTVLPNNADLTLTKTDSPDPVTVGNALTYTLTVSNAGPDAATNVVVTDTLPGSVTFVSATPSQGSCSGTTTVTCNLGTINNGGNATIQIVVTPNTATTITNNASASATEVDSTPASDSENTVINTAVCTPAPSGMVAWYPADGNPFDIQGPTFENGTLQGGATFGAGKVNQGFSFDGSNDYVETTDFFDLNNPGDEVTIEGWIKRNTTGDAGIVSKWINATENGWWFRISGNRFNWGTAVSGTYHQWSSDALFTDTANFHHVALVWKAGDPSSLHVYLDGVELPGSFTTGNGTQVPPNTGQSVLIGTLAPGGEVMNGVIDELELYNRALSQAEILSIYNASSAGKCRECTDPPADMVNWWSGEGNANDIVGTNNGSLQGGATASAAGKVGQAFDLPGSAGDVVDVPYASGFPSSSAGYTIDAWINMDSFDATADGIVSVVNTAGGGGANNIRSRLMVYSSSPGRGGITCGVKNPAAPYEIDFGVPNALFINTWHHVACTVTPNAPVRIYVDGVLVGTDTTNVGATLPADVNNVYIGSGEQPTIWNADGLIDEVEIFNRALSQTEIAAIANSGNAGKCHTSTIQFSSATYSADETDSTATITVTRTGAHDTSASFHYATSAGTATDGSDYDDTSGDLTFDPGQVSKTFTVTLHDDSNFEGPETVNLTLSAITGTGVSAGTPLSAVLTINDSETAPDVTIDDVSLAEGSPSGTTNFVFTVSLSTATQSGVTVNYSTADGTTSPANAGTDYTAATSSIVIPANEASGQITIAVSQDTTVELDETFFVNLTSTSVGTITDSQGLGTIVNDDTEISVAVSPASATEDGAPNLVYTFTRSGVTTGPLTANFSISGTANPSDDYAHVPNGTDTFTPPTGTVSFGATESSATVTIDPSTDLSYEPNETVILTVTSGTGYNLGSPTGATGTITNDTAIPLGLIVTKTADTNDGFCSLEDCSLREAISNANTNPDANYIGFDIDAATDSGCVPATGVCTIKPTLALPAITNPVAIDGYTQKPCGVNPAPCSQPNTLANGVDAVLLIELSGLSAPANTDGLVITAGPSGTVDGSIIKGLVINRFGGNGVKITTGGGTFGAINEVVGNFIGTDQTGMLASDINGPFGNKVGVFVDNTSSNMIGCTSADERNLISANTQEGVLISGTNATQNLVQGNFIGTDKLGAALGNGFWGVSIVDASQSIIGLDVNGFGNANLIAHNGADGVAVRLETLAGVDNVIRGNSIHSNAHLGIDLGPDGLTVNDANDTDTGTNNLQNFPIIRTAQTGSPNVIRGTLNSTPSQTFTIDLYSNTSCSTPGGNGEGQTYLGSTTATTGANGDALWSFSPTTLNIGDVITATATDSSGSTSEFSACVAAAAINFGEIKFAQANTNDTETNAGTHTANIVVQRVNGSDRAVSVTYTITDGTAQNDNPATEDNDYSVVLATGTLNWANGDSSDKNIPIVVNGDTKFELDETVNITLSAPTGGATITGPTAATLTIVNDDTQPTISINDVTQVEGNGPGTTGFTFTVSLSNASYLPITVDYQTANGTTNPATAGTDYTAIGSTQLTFNPDETNQPVTVQVSGDTTYEESETFFVNLSNPSNATSGDMQGLGTITNDDAQPAISIDDVSHVEGNVSGVDNDPDLTNYDFTVTLANPSYQTITVDYATANNTAAAPGDFNAVTSTTLTFLPGETSKPLTVVVKGDTTYELNETFFVNLTNPTNATTTDQGVGTITNDDAAPTLVIGDRTMNEGSTLGVSTSFNFTVTKTGSTDVTATVSFATAPGSAAANVAPCPSGDDYQTQSGSLSFLASETTKTITVPVCKDTTFEGNETFFVNLSGETHSTVSDSQGLGTILNDDIPSSGFTVNTTDDLNDTVCDGTHCSLREAIIASNGSATAVAINFALPATDGRHFYYQDDGSGSPNGTVSPANIAVTSASDDTTISGIDPDWPHSWWSILPTSQLPASTKQVLIDGYSQTGAVANTLATRTNAVLRIELNGSSAGANSNGLIMSGGTSTLRGLAINRFLRDVTAPTPTGNGVSVTSGSNSIAGNFIGTDVSGTLDAGNSGSGVIISGFTTTLGGVTPDLVNLISGNDIDGLTFPNSNSNVVLGNFIGTRANATTGLGNGNGISLLGAGAIANTVGGTNAGEANTIAFNTGDGINLSTASFGNTLRGNSIFSNGTTSAHLGIDLGTDGITANDATDADNGPNSLQNFPVITLARVTGSTRTITGTLNSTPTETFTIDFYQSPSCDNSGNGEGKTYLGSMTTDPTDANGDVSFTFNPSVLTIGQVLTATATSTGASFNTSEFSQCYTVNDGSPGAGAIQFTSATYSVGESATTASITVTRVGGTNGSVTANFSTSNGTAQAPGDYQTVTNLPITYVEGETGDKTVTVTIVNNSSFELSETVNLSLSSTTINRPAVLAPSADPYSAVLTINDDDTAPSLAINDVTHLEGNAGTTSYVFTVTKTGNTEVNATVDYATSPNTATSPSDFAAVATTTLTFLPADTTRQFTVLINGDSTVEPNEDFAVNLSNATNATISDATGAGNITNDDTDVTVTVTPSAAAENGTPNLVYTFTRTGVTTGAITVNFSVGGTANLTDYTESGSDVYTATNGSITFGAGVTGKQVTLDPVADNTVEADETIVLTVSSGTGYNVGSPSVATGTITNDDTEVTVAVSPSSATEDGVPNLVYTFTRNGVTTGALTVNFSVGGTATFSTDYNQLGAASFTSTTGTVTFGAGNSTAQVTIDPSLDSAVESDESSILTVTSGTGYNVASPSAATGTITNDDTDVTLAVSPSATAEDGATNLVYTFTRNGVTSGALTVNFSVAGTAAFTGDYSQTGAATFSASSGTVTFGAGNSTATVTLDPAADTTVESDETAILTLTSGAGYNVGTPSGATGNITNDDTDVTLSVSPSSVTEDGVPNLVYTFTRNGVTTGALTVNFSVAGTATFATDYTQTGAATFSVSSGTVTFGAGNSTATVTIDPATDTSAEANETVILTLASGTGYNVGTPSAATGTITNDDSSGGIVRFSSAFYNTTENSRFVTITVERGGDTSAPVTVDYATPDDSDASTVVPCETINGSASPRCDFTTALGTLRFAAGETSKTFAVLISQDNYVEGPETLTLTLSNLTGGAVFGAPSTSTLTIADDVTEPAANPIDEAENFVRQHYHDFLNREPDAAGLAFWTDQITSCGTDQACIQNKRINVSAAFYLSIEFQGTGYFVERLYKSSYGSATSSSTNGGAHTLQVPVVRFSEFLLDTQEIGLGVVVGAPGWEAALENNKAAFVDRFVQRSRFASEYPVSMTPAAFVDKLNTNAGNPLSTAERDQLVADLSNSTRTRAQVVRAVTEDSDLVSAEFNRAFVLMQYFGYLRRNPNAAPDSDHTGFDFWLTKLNQFNGNFINAEMVKAFITSGEYRRRSGQ